MTELSTSVAKRLGTRTANCPIIAQTGKGLSLDSNFGRGQEQLLARTCINALAYGLRDFGNELPMSEASNYIQYMASELTVVGFSVY